MIVLTFSMANVVTMIGYSSNVYLENLSFVAAIIITINIKPYLYQESHYNIDSKATNKPLLRSFAG